MNAAVIERSRSSLHCLIAVAFVIAGCTSTGSVGNLDGGTTGGSTSGTGGTTGGTSTGGTGTGGTGGLSAGAACSGNAQCLSDACGVFGSGYCCAAQCMAAIDSACNPIGCAANSGACTYPVGAACGSQTCATGMLTAGACDATGACSPSNSVCPGNLLCNGTGTACLSSCGTTLDCAAGFFCNGGACVQKVATGACTEDDDCSSGICGVAGRGFCCTNACSTTNPICGASGCDPTGACVYPDKTVSCGSAQVCVASTELGAFLCDGQGACPTPATTDCSPYACNDTTDPPACVVSCQDDTSCVAGGFCEPAYATCCTLASKGTINVDSVSGSDDAGCCGVGMTPPCQTLSRAMALIDAARATDVTIAATVDGGGGDWSPAGEVYPVVLGWGVELNAPGVYFIDPSGNDNSAIIAVQAYSQNDLVGYASVVGSPGNPIGIGLNAAQDAQLTDGTAVSISGTRLYLANALLNGRNNGDVAALSLSGGGSLIFGQDHPAAITGTVTIGVPSPTSPGGLGVYCLCTSAAPCTVEDVAQDGGPSVVLQGQIIDMFVFDYCSILLTAGPIFGYPATAAGCPIGQDGVGVAIAGASAATLGQAVFQCEQVEGLTMGSDSSGTPIVTIDNSIIESSGIGLYGFSGSTATVTNSTISNNGIGIWQSTDGVTNSAIDLSGGGNVVICNNAGNLAAEQTGVAMSVYNTSTASLNAANVAWDTPGPDYFTCDSAFASCSCNLASCVAAPGSNGMDAVEDSTNLGGILTTGNTLSALFLDAGCP